MADNGSMIERMAGTTGLEPATSAGTGVWSSSGARRINRLWVRESASIGFVGHRWRLLCNHLCNPPSVGRVPGPDTNTWIANSAPYLCNRILIQRLDRDG